MAKRRYTFQLKSRIFLVLVHNLELIVVNTAHIQLTIQVEHLRWVTNLEEGAVLDDNVVHMEGADAGEVAGQGDEVGWVIRAVELQEVRSERIRVAGPAQLSQSLLQFCMGMDYLIGRDVDKNTGPSSGSGGGTRVAVWLLPLERLPCGVWDQPGYSILVENPHSRHLTTCSDLLLSL